MNHIFKKRFAFFYLWMTSIIAIESFSTMVYASDTSLLLDTGNKSYSTKNANTRVFSEDISLLNETSETNNLVALNSTMPITKDQINLVGLKGTMKIKDDIYYINYTGDETLDIQIVSAFNEVNKTKYPITRVDIFKEMDENSDIIANYFFNEKVHIVGEYLNWYKVKLQDGSFGYTNSNYLFDHPSILERENRETHIYNEDRRVGMDLKEIEMGSFRITAYCNCEICCGQYAWKGTTATNTHVTENRTIAVDPQVIPLGSEVTFNGNTFKAEDVGGAIKDKHIDVYIAEHDRAWHYTGAGYKDVKIKVN